MVVTLIISIAIGIGFVNAPVSFAAGPGVMISQIQTGGTGTGTADQEFVEVYNSSPVDFDVTGWCLQYISAGDKEFDKPYKLGCLTTPDVSTRVWLKAGAYFTLASSAYQNATGIQSDITSSYTGMAATGGHVRLLDVADTEHDRAGWGTAANPETNAAPAPTGGSSIIRGYLQDTDDNSVDFLVDTMPIIHTDGLYDVTTVVDVCGNIDGDQTTLPIGYEVDDKGDCYIDTCNNIGGLQLAMPDGKKSDGAGGCVDIDVCMNLDGAQVAVPSGYKLVADNETCLLDLAPLQITELLADASGSDMGNEFIEIYNPGTTIIDLTNYRLQVGQQLDKTYAFPADATVPAGSYAVFYNSSIRFTLVNTTSRVGLVSADGQVIDQPPAYSDPPESESWALIGSAWQFTNQPTPAAANLVSIIDVTDTEEVTVATPTALKPCAAGQYRNPATGRCKKIEISSGLVPCKDGQYRSEETGRCRSIVKDAASTLKPCADDEFRNPATNRCKKIASTEDVIKPCEVGYERNPETNRCRKIVASAAAAYAVEPSASVSSKVSWIAASLGVLGLTAAVVIFQYRMEIAGLFKKLVP